MTVDEDVDQRFRRLERRLDGNGRAPEFVRTDIYELVIGSISKDLGELKDTLKDIRGAQASSRRWLGRLVLSVVITVCGTIIAGIVIASVTAR